MIPILKREGVAGIGWEAEARDIDIDLLTGGYRRMIRAGGGQIICNARVTALARSSVWRAETPAGVFEAPVVVNAAGAWATPVAAMAGAAKIEITNAGHIITRWLSS